ncbi:MAG: hypothetical protein JWM86_1097 [Thermoleophilia bacterium]|nr:hypothetical protein [Thermoleophilia bacterium]
MKVLGIDMASQPRKTAACRIDTAGAAAPRVVSIDDDLTNDALVQLVDGCTWVGIDAPFGWPRPFVEAIAGWSNGHAWPSHDRNGRPMTLRWTDVFVQRATGRRPLSVSADRIAYTAMRTAALLTSLQARPDGRGTWTTPTGVQVVEVYPAGTLQALALSTRGYKAAGAGDLRAQVGAAIAERWSVEAPGADVRRTDDTFDAWVAALTAWRAALGRTHVPRHDLHADGGWIHLPEEADVDPACWDLLDVT